LDFSKRNDTIYIDTEALSTLSLIQEGLLYPVNKLMSEKEAKEVDETKQYKGLPFPFSFILSPSGRRNEEHIKNLKKGDRAILINNGKDVGYIIVDDVFKIDKEKRLRTIYGTCDTSIPIVARAKSRMGEWAVSGEYKVIYPQTSQTIKFVKEKIKEFGVNSIAGLMLGANPLTRAHEKLIREAINENELLIIFLTKPFTKEGLKYSIRKKSLEIFVKNFLPANRVLIVPFENSYIFAGYNELILDALVAKNFGCNKLIVGRNHRALGAIYDEDKMNTIFDTFKNIDIKIDLKDEFVYCDVCRTLVTTRTCPHGTHHHIHYHYKSILELITKGILPPTILVRKEVSASIMSHLYPNRFENLQETYEMLFPSSGLLEDKTEEEFYIQLMKLYQTSSLT